MVNTIADEKLKPIEGAMEKLRFEREIILKHKSEVTVKPIVPISAPARVSCPACGRVMLKSSLSTHRTKVCKAYRH